MQQQRLNQLTVYTVSYMYSCSVDALVGGIVGERLQLHRASTAEGLEGGRRTRRTGYRGGKRQRQRYGPDARLALRRMGIPSATVSGRQGGRGREFLSISVALMSTSHAPTPLASTSPLELFHEREPGGTGIAFAALPHMARINGRIYRKNTPKA